jgi:hypothetical protein
MNLAAAPEIIAVCPSCGGEGHTLHRISVYEHGCGFPHDDVEAQHYTDCHGVGFSIEEVQISIADQCTTGMELIHRRNDVRSTGVIRTARFPVGNELAFGT